MGIRPRAPRRSAAPVAYVLASCCTAVARGSPCPPDLFTHAAGPTECFVDLDTGTSSLVLYSSGLPHHWFDPDAAGARAQAWAPEFPLRPVPDTQRPGGGVSVAAGEVVGFALNGVPFIMAPHPAIAPEFFGSADGCLGLVQPATGAYYYATPPPCLFPVPGLHEQGEHGHGHGPTHGHDGHDHRRTSWDRGPALDPESSLTTAFVALGFPSPRIGIALGSSACRRLLWKRVLLP